MPFDTAASRDDCLTASVPDLELEDWRVPTLRPFGNAASDDDGPRCPNCGGRLIFERFHRIRPPPLTHRAILARPPAIRR
jgi:hypothetical protein